MTQLKTNLPKFCWLTTAYATVAGTLAFLLASGLGRTIADGLKAGDGWTVLGIIAVAAYCAFNETINHGDDHE